MDIVFKLVKKVLCKLRQYYLKYKHQRHSFSESTGDSGSSQYQAVFGLKSKVDMEFGNVLRHVPNQEDSDSDSSEDSGISTTRNNPGCKTVKKLQFSVVTEVHEIDSQRRSFSPLKRMKTCENLPYCVKYYQTAEPQVPVIVNQKPLIDQQPCDSIRNDEYLVPVGTTPVKPPRKTILKVTTNNVKNPSVIYATIIPKALRNSTDSENSAKSSSSPLSSDKFKPQITSSANDLLEPKTKESLNLIHNTEFHNMNDIFPDHECNNQTTKNDQVIKLQRKFVVNGYESRPSAKLEPTEEKVPLPCSKINIQPAPAIAKFTTIRENFDEKCFILETNAQNLKQQCHYMELKSSKFDTELQDFAEKLSLMEEKFALPQEISEENAMRYQSLRKARDIECIKMSQASKAMYEMKTKSGKQDWLEQLIAEKILLETSERVKLLELQIQDTMYSLVNLSPMIEGTIELSEIRFPFATGQSDCPTDKDYTEFFILVLTHADQIYTSEYITGEQSPLKFEKKFVLRNVPPNFEIKLKLFCLKQRTSDEYLWEKLNNNSKCCEFLPKLRIIYQNRLTKQFEDESVITTSFKLCAETFLTPNQINKPTSSLLLIKDVFDKLDGFVQHNFKCENVNIKIELSRFLNVGRLIRGAYIWERKWCILSGANILIYNYPHEQEFSTPIEQFNLQYAFGPLVTNVRNCPRKRTFQLKIANPEDNLGETLSPNSSTAIKTFYFSCQSADDFEEWTEKVEEILKALRYFKKLVYEHEGFVN